MVSTRSLRIFNLYDVLGVFFPGTTLLIGAYVLVPRIPDPSSVIQYLGVIVVAFATGHLLQSYSSFPTDDLKIFDATIKEVQKPLSSLNDFSNGDGEAVVDDGESDVSRTDEESVDVEPGDDVSEDDDSGDDSSEDRVSEDDESGDDGSEGGVSEDDESGDDGSEENESRDDGSEEDESRDDSSKGDTSTSAELEPIEESNWVYLNLFYPFIGPIWCLVDVIPRVRSWNCITGTPNAGGLTDLQNPNRVWIELNTEYDFEPGQNRFDEMQQVISSRTDDPASPSRSYRFQAIRNFQRGTWLAVWILFATVASTTVWTAAVRYCLGNIAYSHPLAESYLFTTLPLWIIVGGGIVGVLAFWWQTLQYERLFIRFLITDYVVLLNQANQTQRIQLQFED